MEARILMVSRKLMPEGGGGEISAYFIAKAISELVPNNLLLTFYDGKEIQEYKDGNLNIKKIPFKYTHMKYLDNLDYMYWFLKRHIKKEIKTFKPDLIHCFNMSSIIACKDINIPHTGTMNGMWMSCFIGDGMDKNDEICYVCKYKKRTECINYYHRKKWFKWAIKIYSIYAQLNYDESLAACKKLIPVSSQIDNVLKANGHNHNVIIHNPIHVKRTEPKKPHDRIVIIYAGRIVESKKPHWVIQAIKNNPKYLLYIIGDGNYLDECKKMAGDNTIFIDKMPHDKVLEFMQGCDIAVNIGGRLDAYSRFIGEAMALEMPVVAINSGGFLDLIDNGKNGYLVNSVEELKNALELIQLQEFGKYSKQKILKQSAPEMVARKYVDVFQQCLKNGKK